MAVEEAVLVKVVDTLLVPVVVFVDVTVDTQLSHLRGHCT